MNDLNKVILIGRLTRDAETKYTNAGLAVMRFSIAVNRSKKSGVTWTDEANFVDCTYFGKAAEAVSQYMTKGKQIAIDGELRQDKWEQDGQQRSKLQVVANNVQLLGGGKAQGNQATDNAARVFGGQAVDNDGTSQEFDDDITF